MKLKKCDNGHFYDADKFPECPYCNTDLQTGSIVSTTPAAATAGQDTENGQGAAAQGPVAGWLVVLDGPARGQDFRLNEGRNFFGLNGAGAPQALGEDAPLAARLLTVAYDPAAGTFCALPGSGRELAYVNGQANLSQQALAAGDTIRLGTGSMRFVPFCGAEFRWQNTESVAEKPAEPKPKKATRPAGSPARTKPRAVVQKPASGGVTAAEKTSVQEKPAGTAPGKESGSRGK